MPSLKFWIIGEDKSGSAAMEKIGRSARTASADVRGVGKSMSGVKQEATGLLLKGAALFGGADLLRQAGAASDATDKFKKTLNFAGLKTAGIDDATKKTQAYADQTVYDLGTIQNTTAQLAANGIPNFEKLTEAAGNLNAVAGGSPETFKSLAMVMTQTAGAGKLTTENWNQLADAIPGASGVVQKALLQAGAYTGNFRTAMEKGQISADEFNAAIMKLGNQPVAVEAAKSTETFEGALGSLQATIVGKLTKALSAMKPMLTGIINDISGVVNEFAGGIQAFIGAWQAFDGDVTSSGFPGFMERLAFVARSTFEWMKKYQNILIPVAAGIGAMVAAIKVWTLATKAAAATQVALNAVLAANPIGLVVLALVGLGTALFVAYKKSETFRNIVNGVFHAIAAAGKWMWNNVLKPVFDAIQTALGVVGGVASTFAGVWNAAWGTVGDGLRWVYNHTIKPVIDMIMAGINAVRTAWDWLMGSGPGPEAQSKALGQGPRTNPGHTGGGGDPSKFNGAGKGRAFAHGGIILPRAGGQIATVNGMRGRFAEAGQPEAVMPLSALNQFFNARGGGRGDTYEITISGFVGNEQQLGNEIVRVIRKVQRTQGKPVTV